MYFFSEIICIFDFFVVTLWPKCEITLLTNNIY